LFNLPFNFSVFLKGGMIATSWDFETGGKSEGKIIKFNLIRSPKVWIEIA